MIAEGTFPFAQLMQFQAKEYDGQVKLFYNGKDAGEVNVSLKLNMMA